MSRAILRIGNNQDIFLRETKVENLFINEYLPSAPGDFVRVYLFALMVAQNEESFEIEKVARILGLPVAEVHEAFRYWTRKGIIRMYHTEDEEDIGIEFLSLIDAMYARRIPMEPDDVALPEDVRNSYEASYDDDDFDDEDENGETPAEKIVRLIDEGIKETYNEYERCTGRLLTRKEMELISDAIHVYEINPEVMSYAIKYCADLEKYNANYITKVALRWKSEGCRNIADVRDYLERFSRRNADYASIFKELGWSRLPSPAEREMMSDWMDNKGYSLSEIISACRKSAGIREPNLKYVSKVLENQAREKGGIRVPHIPHNASNVERNATEKETANVSKAVLEEYYSYLRAEAEKKQNAKIDSMCARYTSIRNLYEEENELNNRIIQLSFKADAKKERAELKEARKSLDNRKRQALFEVGFPPDYLDIKYSCRLCGDTGMTNDGLLCACRKTRAREAFEWNIARQNKN